MQHWWWHWQSPPPLFVHARTYPEVIGEDTQPPPKKKTQPSAHFDPKNQQPVPHFDSQYSHWKFEFYAASDKPLGTPTDTNMIRALIPSTIPPTIRWVSRSVVVVAADCSSNGEFRCLYVLEKHGSKWKLTHHYPHELNLIFSLTNRWSELRKYYASASASKMYPFLDCCRAAGFASWLATGARLHFK